MSAPNPCPGCRGSGWVRYIVETVDGEEEWAWSLCPECEGGDAFPPKEGGAGWRERRVALRERHSDELGPGEGFDTLCGSGPRLHWREEQNKVFAHVGGRI